MCFKHFLNVFLYQIPEFFFETLSAVFDSVAGGQALVSGGSPECCGTWFELTLEILQ